LPPALLSENLLQPVNETSITSNANGNCTITEYMCHQARWGDMGVVKGTLAHLQGTP